MVAHLTEPIAPEYVDHCSSTWVRRRSLTPECDQGCAHQSNMRFSSCLCATQRHHRLAVQLEHTARPDPDADPCHAGRVNVVIMSPAGLSRIPATWQVNDLPTLDAELYRSLMFLRDYDGDVADLALNFSIVDGDLGSNHEARREGWGKGCFEGSGKVCYEGWGQGQGAHMLSQA